MHSWSGPQGVPGGPERWQHGAYRWRRGLEAVALLVATLILAPHVMAAAELVVGAGLMALGLLWLVWRARPQRRHRRFDVLALLLAIVALVEARRSRTPA